MSELPTIDPNLHIQYPNVPPDFLRELLECFIIHIPKVKKEIRRAFEHKNLKHLQAQLHQLKGTSLYCGLLDLHARIQALTNPVSAIQMTETDLIQLEMALDRVIEAKAKTFP